MRCTSFMVFAYSRVLAQTEGRSLVVEEYARGQIATEKMHAGEIEKTLHHPGA